MLAILFLAQVVAAAPAPTPAAALGSASTAVSSKPRTLADVARERRIGKKGTAGGTLSVSGASGMPVVPAETESCPVGAGIPAGYTRVRSAEADLQAARRAVDDAAVKKGVSSEDTAAARRKLDGARRELNQAREAASRSDR